MEKTRRGYKVSYAWRAQADVLILGAFLGLSLSLTIIALILPTSFQVMIFLALTLLFDYIGIAMAVNKTSVEVTREQIIVRHGPLPWRSKLATTLTEVEHIFALPWRGSKGVSYDVFASTASGESVKLFGSIARAPTADHLAAEVRHCANRTRGLPAA